MNGTPDAPPEYVEAFVASTREVLQTMALLDAVCSRTCPPAECGGPYGMGAAMTLSGKATGLIVVGTGRELAGRIVAAMMGRARETLEDEQLTGGILEITNMIAGGAKSRLAGTSYHFELSTPQPCALQDFLARNPPPATPHAAVFDVETEPLVVVVSLAGLLEPES